MKKKFARVIAFVLIFPWSIVAVPIAAAANSCSDNHQEVSQ